MEMERRGIQTLPLSSQKEKPMLSIRGGDGGRVAQKTSLRQQAEVQIE
jgi:hypothetical protein